MKIVFPKVGVARTVQQQAGYQLAALGVSLAIAILGGAFSGFCASRLGRTVEHLFDDEEHWHGCTYDVPLEEEEVNPAKGSNLDNAQKDSEEDNYEYEHESESDGKENIQ